MIEAGRPKQRAPQGGPRGANGSGRGPEGSEAGGEADSKPGGAAHRAPRAGAHPDAARGAGGGVGRSAHERGAAAASSASSSASSSAGRPGHEPLPRQASALSRQALALYAALIVYGSWYPFSGWRSLGLSPFAYLGDPFPRYWTVFDIVTNVLGYMPFGALVVLAAWPRWRGVRAVLLASVAGTLLSGVMEAVQTWLPTRVASNLDLASNALGALLGAVLAAPATGALLERGFLRRLRFRWFERDAGMLMVLASLWPFATMFPAPRLFGMGDWPRALWQRFDASMQDVMLAWTPAAWHLRALPDALAARLPDTGWEAIVTTLNLFGAAAFASLPMRARAPRARLMLLLIAVTLVVKAGATFLQSQSGLVFDWATPGALVGLACGTFVALVALRLPRAARATAAACALALALVLVNVLPVNPYFDVVLEDWRQGRYLHFNGLARWLAWTWPWAALAWAAFSAERAWLLRRASRRS
ncbi:VanZ family protein [Paraburkholderia acidisoli]|uniref:Teicoplanin resistance protein VanZ n=1 Tax=Paraburkholderia acidisoli TaxID=2571748 RepID=A0A7Z2GEM5_9BURK|nr:VanZ family protein [Paraburkholderia acidisoli]QGZ60431.1 teicoplanin resistance protein VanZ [Paraburkholderia acidisoli]